jgi:hypothetical protein
MKRLGTVILLAVILCIIFTPEVLSQVVKVKVEAMSPGRRSSGPPNFTAPAGDWFVSTGLRVVAKSMYVYLSADTTGSDTNVATSFAWTFVTKPGGSATDFSTRSDSIGVAFMPDVIGEYIIQVTVNGSVTALDTVLASTYTGVTTTYPGCAVGCHNSVKTEWEATLHATIFKRGVTGNLENRPSDDKGAYAGGCIKCHTTGWAQSADNGNFGYLAHTGAPAWDTTWYQGLPLEGGDYWITKDSMGIWDGIPANMVGVATIGCETCHGPGADHKGGLNLGARGVDKTLDAGVCLQCHDAPKKHRLGSYWAASKHGLLPEGGHTNRTNCYPCHSGGAFYKFTKNRTSPGWSAADGNIPISCQVCHEPHSEANPYQLRTVVFDSLLTGFKPASGQGGLGQLCMNCHRGRYNVNTKITTTAPYYGWSDRFYNHYSPQADMLFGDNGYEYNGLVVGTSSVHLTYTQNSCVTCHMQKRTNGSSVHSNHEMRMDADGADLVGACQPCHSEVTTSFEDKMANGDYDNDGTVEPFVTEIDGLLETLKANLPIDSETGEPVNMMKDTLAIKNRPDLVQGVWNYYFVKDDMSHGIHNPAYAVAMLRNAIFIITGVEYVDETVPSEFALEQNYPNPFNPTTEIRFALPIAGPVLLEVYDLTGRVVATLVNQDLQAGTHRVVWNARNNRGESLSSGVYLYRISFSGFVSTRKMVLLK